MSKKKCDKKVFSEIYPYNAQHIGMRNEQQDAFAFSDIFDKEALKKYGAVAVLADGMGGMENGKQAAEAAVNVFLEYYIKSFDGNVLSSMLNGVLCANVSVCEISGAGSTISAVVIKDDYLHWISVGDSRIYLFRNGKIKQLNKEHNYGAVLDNRAMNGEISYEEASFAPNRHALTSYLGLEELEEIDFNLEHFPIKEGDSLLLCSDGLYKTVNENEMSYALLNCDDNVADVLVERALSKGSSSQDNVTVMVIDID